MKFIFIRHVDIGKIMRISFTQISLLMLLTGLSYARVAYPQDILGTHITIRAQDITLREALQSIERKSGIKFG